MTPDEIASYGDKFTFEDVVERTNKGLESGYSNETVDDIIEELARDEYFGNPYEMIEAVDAGPNTFALGNEDIGYSIFVDGKRIENKLPQGYHGDPTPYNNIEARIQLRQAMADEGYDYFRLEGEEGIYDNIQYKEYIDVQKGGLYNMFDARARMMTSLNKQQWMNIITNYELYHNKWGL